MEIKGDNKTILLDVKNHLDGGEFYFINCPKLFMDGYFFGSIYKRNSLIKYKEDGNFIQYYQINK